MRVCVDPGHGQDNRRPSVYDPGACHVEAGVKFEEATIVLAYSRMLADAFLAHGHDVMMTRGSKNDPCPVWKRASKAQVWKADVLISMHVNDADSDTANGAEVLWRSPQSLALAREVQRAIVMAAGMRDRGVKQRPDLSVLSFSGPAILIELGFIAHDEDRRKIMDEMMRVRVCDTIADTVIQWWKARKK